MSWQATSYVKGLIVAPDKSTLTRTEKLLLFILADYHNTEQHGAWPSVKTLARDSLLTVRHVRRTLAFLKNKRLLCISRRRNPDRGFKSNFYHFHALDCNGDHEAGSDIMSPPSDPESPPSDPESPPDDRMSPPTASRRSRVVSSRNRTPFIEDQVDPPKEKPINEPDVCVRPKSKFTLEQILRYARADFSYVARMQSRGKKVEGIRNPEGWAVAAYQSGKFDEIIERFYTSETDMYDVPPLL